MASPDAERPLRLAVYGIVDQAGGSVGSADYLLLRGLLDAGHGVDLYAIEGLAKPKGLDERPNYRHIPVGVKSLKPVWRGLEKLRGPIRQATFYGFGWLSNTLHEREIRKRMLAAHRREPYDAVLMLGMMAPFALRGVPCIAWPQGPPNTEWEAIERLRPMIDRYAGRRLFHTLRLGYSVKMRAARKQAAHQDRTIVGSRWSIDACVRFGIPRERLRALPYPFDLSQFRPVERRPEGAFRFLWLGRIVPRKRLDLALEAFKRLRAERPDVELMIIGGFAYARGMRRMIDEYAEVGGITYRESIPRSEVPELLSTVDAVLQPSENENLGSSVLEAIACGVPAILGPTNGTMDYVGEASFAFAEYTPESVARTMGVAVDGIRERRAALAAESRAAAEMCLPLEVVLPEFVGIIRGAMAERR